MDTKHKQAFFEERNHNIEDLQAGKNESINFPPHLHTDLELFFVESGCIVVGVGEERRSLTAGCFAVIFPNTIHFYSTKEEHSRFILVISRASLLGEYASKLLSSRPACPFLDASELHLDISYAMNAIWDQKQEGDNTRVYSALIQLILARFLSKIPLVSEREPKSIDLTNQLIHYLANHFQQPLSLESVAKELGVSKYHLSHVFSKRLHTSFNDYINFLRLNYAQDLLRATDQNILEIALACGFSSQRTFNRAFQKHYSLTPRQYRQQRLSP